LGDFVEGTAGGTAKDGCTAVGGRTASPGQSCSSTTASYVSSLPNGSSRELESDFPPDLERLPQRFESRIGFESFFEAKVNLA
jgi:hypothetical protein